VVLARLTGIAGDTGAARVELDGQLEALVRDEREIARSLHAGNDRLRGVASVGIAKATGGCVRGVTRPGEAIVQCRRGRPRSVHEGHDDHLEALVLCAAGDERERPEIARAEARSEMLGERLARRRAGRRASELVPRHRPRRTCRDAELCDGHVGGGRVAARIGRDPHEDLGRVQTRPRERDGCDAEGDEPHPAAT